MLVLRKRIGNEKYIKWRVLTNLEIEEAAGIDVFRRCRLITATNIRAGFQNQNRVRNVLNLKQEKKLLTFLCFFAIVDRFSKY